MKKIPLTKENYEKLQSELEYLKTTRRREVAEGIKKALSHGDISESSEYEEAQHQLSLLENKIAELTAKLAAAEIIEYRKGESGTIGLGTTVSLTDERGETVRYTLVVPDDADLEKQKISFKSPVGEALMGKAKGDAVTVTTPRGLARYTVLSIE